MTKRIRGVVMIVNTLMPIIILLGLAVAGNLFWKFTAQRLKKPIQNMTSALEVLQQEADSARGTIIAVTAEVTDNITAAKIKLEAAGAGVAAATSQIDAAVIPITNFGVPIPGNPKLQERKPTRRNPIPYKVTMRTNLAKPFKDLAKPFESLAAAATQSLAASTEIKKSVEAVKKLSPLADIFAEFKNKFDELARQTKTVIEIFSELGGSISFSLKILAIILLPWLALTYGLWCQQRLSVGWSMLRGHG